MQCARHPQPPTPAGQFHRPPEYSSRIEYCRNLTIEEDNEARRIVDEMMKGGTEEINCADISDPTDPYYNSCDI